MQQKIQPEECLVQSEWRRSRLAAVPTLHGAREVRASAQALAMAEVYVGRPPRLHSLSLRFVSSSPTS